MHVEPGTIVPNLIFGILVVAAGIAIIVNRKALNERIFKEQERMFGRRAARASGGRQTPTMMGAVGCFAVLVGALVLTGGVIGIVQLMTS